MTAGSVAMDGEVAKDTKHQEVVERSGASFVPLVVETLGAWTNMLKSIAARSTIKNGLSVSAAFRNLLQQLSVKLYSYNAKMILHHLQMTTDDLWDVPFV